MRKDKIPTLQSKSKFLNVAFIYYLGLCHTMLASLVRSLFDRLNDPSIIRSAPMRPRMDCIRMVPYLRYTCPMTCKRYMHMSIHDGWLVAGLFCRLTLILAIFHSNRDLEAWDNQSLKLKRRDQESNPGPFGLLAKS